MVATADPNPPKAQRLPYKRHVATRTILGTNPMKFSRRGFEEARAEALRIAEAFVASEAREGSRWSMECSEPEPDQDAPGFDRRKPIVKWVVWARPKSKEGHTIDGGDGWLLVDIETKEARWSE